MLNDTVTDPVSELTVIFDPAVKLVTPVLLIVNPVTGAKLSTPVILIPEPAVALTDVSTRLPASYTEVAVIIPPTHKSLPIPAPPFNINAPVVVDTALVIVVPTKFTAVTVPP